MTNIVSIKIQLLFLLGLAIAISEAQPLASCDSTALQIQGLQDGVVQSHGLTAHYAATQDSSLVQYIFRLDGNSDTAQTNSSYTTQGIVEGFHRLEVSLLDSQGIATPFCGLSFLFAPLPDTTSQTAPDTLPTPTPIPVQTVLVPETTVVHDTVRTVEIKTELRVDTVTLAAPSPDWIGRGLFISALIGTVVTTDRAVRYQQDHADYENATNSIDATSKGDRAERSHTSLLVSSGLTMVAWIATGAWYAWEKWFATSPEAKP